MAGIGCHFMATWMDRATIGFTQMGGEGVPWVGQQPFTNEKHVFANLGDGTYFHSGLLAIRQSIAAGVNITYKILYNDAVAMTGGQQVGERPEGHSCMQIAHSLRPRACALSDRHRRTREVRGEAAAGRRGPPPRRAGQDPARVPRDQGHDGPSSTTRPARPRSAAGRKRGTMVDPAVRVVINDLVCEGCGDCSVKSNCLSVEPLENRVRPQAHRSTRAPATRTPAA
jgi:indolepyruvate ferredoxin oxidoreductase